jgi:hypothetical protein
LRYKQSIVYLVLGIITLLFVSLITISYSSLYAQQQQLKQNNSAIVGVKITSPTKGQQVPVGSLTISGTSTDNANSDCTVYTDWNDLGPYQKVLANGPGGTNDYSKWSFTYTSAYHLITNGTNQLTAKISCLASPSTNLTKWYSINIIGVSAALNQTETQVPTTTTIHNTTTSDTASSILANSSSIPSPLTKVNLNNSNDNNDDEEDSSNGKADRNKAVHKQDNTANNSNNDDDSKTDNSSHKPHEKHDNSKSKTTTHHHDDHSEKEAKHIIKDKTKEVKHKIKHLKKEINKEISKVI